MKTYIQFINEKFLKSDAIGYNIGKYLFHTTPTKNINQIKKFGLIPQNGISINGEKYTNRLYLATSQIAAYDIYVNFSSYKNEKDYSIIKINSNAISTYEKDPLFQHGIYIDYKIPPEYIVSIINADSLFNKYNEDDLDNLYL